jgi:hypothetical protein
MWDCGPKVTETDENVASRTSYFSALEKELQPCESLCLWFDCGLLQPLSLAKLPDQTVKFQSNLLCLEAFSTPD